MTFYLLLLLLLPLRLSLLLSSGSCIVDENQLYYLGGKRFNIEDQKFHINNDIYILDFNQSFKIKENIAPWKQYNQSTIELQLNTMFNVINENNNILIIGGKEKNVNDFILDYNINNGTINKLNLKNNPYFYNIIEQQENKKITYLLFNLIKLDGNDNNNHDYLLYGGVFINQYNKLKYMTKLFLYNKQLDEWKDNNIQYPPIISHYSIIYNNQLITIGGVDKDNNFNSLNQISIFNFTNNRFNMINTKGIQLPNNLYSRSLKINNTIYTLINLNKTHSTLYYLNLVNFEWKDSNIIYNFNIVADSCLINISNYLIQSFGSNNEEQLKSTQLIDLVTFQQTNSYISLNNITKEEEEDSSFFNNLDINNLNTSTNEKSTNFAMVTGITLSSLILLLLLLGYLIKRRLNYNISFTSKIKKSTKIKPDNISIPSSEKDKDVFYIPLSPPADNSIPTSNIYTSFPTAIHSTSVQSPNTSLQFDNKDIYVSTANSVDYN